MIAGLDWVTAKRCLRHLASGNCFYEHRSTFFDVGIVARLFSARKHIPGQTQLLEFRDERG
jgi:hypothetical protein